MMTFPALLLPAAGKSYIDSWPIYARHVVCVKFPFGTPRRMRLLLLLLLWQDDPFSAPLHHLLTRPRTHTHTAILQHTHSETAHTLPLSTAIPWHNHSLWLCGAAIGSARARLVALAGHALPVLPQRGCGLLRECVCVSACVSYMRRGLAALRTFPQDAFPWRFMPAPSGCCIRCLPALDVDAAVAAEQLFWLVLIEIMRQSW